jgi:hypothetical protein
MLNNYYFHQNLVQWLRNTWRGEKRLSKMTLKKYRMHDLLWWLKKDDVLKEISTLTGIENITTKNPKWFTHRMEASRNILDMMSQSEKEEIRRMGEIFAKEGLPEEIKRK